jgi:hypothetical protein
MLTPEQFPNADDFIIALNSLKLDKNTCRILASVDDEDSANEFTGLYIALGCRDRFIPDGVES